MNERATHDPAAHDASGAIVAAISREIVGIYAERVLVDGGRFDQVRLNRQAFQDQIEPVFRQRIEKVTGRKVVTCLSQINRDGVACEIFMLGPYSRDPD